MNEHQHIEWKLSWRDEYLKWICAFANAFFRAGKIEAWGRGIERIMESCAAAGAMTPELRFESSGIWFVFKYPTNLESPTQETTQETTQEKIVALLKAAPTTTRKELAGKLGISSDGIKYHLEKMKSAGVIRHVGATKTGYWEVLK